MAKNNVRILAGTEIFLFVISTKVGIAIRLWAGRFGFRIPAGKRDFLFSKSSTSALGTTQPPLQWVEWFFAEGEAAGVSLYSPSSAEDQNE